MNDDPYPRQVMPKSSWVWRRRLFLLVLLVSLILAIWRDSAWYVVGGIAIGFLGEWTVGLSARCPSCSRSLRARTVRETNDWKRYVFDCSDCQITWDTEHLESAGD